MSLASTILDIVFPQKCLSCGEKGVVLCIKCLADSPSAERESTRWIFPLFDYRHPPVKKAIALMKYKGKKKIAGVLAEVLYGKIIEELSEFSVMENFREPILIPIPLSKKRYRERGYNQAELICRKLAKLDNNANFELKNNILIKPKDTEHQARIEDRGKRLKNIVGSFAVENPEPIKNRNIILIDDVTTTGATLNEARKILKQNGAKKIIAFAVAH
jgi:competence protein ComFC